MAFGKVKVAPTHIPDRSWAGAPPAIYDKVVGQLSEKDRYLVELSDSDLQAHIRNVRKHCKHCIAEQVFCHGLAIFSAVTVINLWAVPIFEGFAKMSRDRSKKHHTEVITLQREALRNKVLVDIELEKFNSFTV